MIIQLHQRDFFLSIFKAFTDKKQVDITISSDNLLIKVIEIDRIYFNLDKSNFSSNFDFKISLDPSNLYKALNLLNTNLIEIENDHVLLKNFNNSFESFVKIPLLSTKDHCYEEITEIHTRFMIHPKNIESICFLKGLVRYEIENDTLFIRKMAREVFNEIEIRDVDFIDVGELSFSCNNNWVSMIESISKEIKGIIFNFSDCFLSVQFLFENNENVFLEIQIPKSLIK
ncbi:hypothetical protein NBO_1109g0001 [Nosema bombycis CQ1]|uniref:Proliferating cell nuclear antigen n=1 Tax=Nosema bombycis (strain CQ1 / CVCC 102059) TaxID=578461 RepID=R0KN00_NOSB1|nr:hypothetical protein NBO_1109g0001 [Nosema bombycis CQ1]|eukprot:EOB11517.1 hypothetical protein NBO_1109g0001 [Nosema bombycis CQ1]